MAHIRREFRMIVRDKAGLIQQILFGLGICVLGGATLANVGGTEATMGIFWTSLALNFVLDLEATHRLEFGNGVWRRFVIAGRDGGGLNGWLAGKMMGGIVRSTLIVPVLGIAAMIFGRSEPSVMGPIVATGVAVAVGFWALILLVLPISQATGRRSIVAPMLLFPLGFPLLLSGHNAALDLLHGSGMFWVGWIIVQDCVYTGLLVVLWEKLLYES